MREELYNAITARDATETTRLISAGIARTGTFTKIFASPHPVGIFEDLDGRNTIFHLLAQSGMIRDILPVLKSQLFSPKFLNREKLDMQLSTPANAERFLSQKMLQKNAKGVLPIHIAINTGNKGDVEYIVDNYGITFDDIMISSIFRDPEPMGWLLNYKIDLNTFKEIYKTFFGTIYCYNNDMELKNISIKKIASSSDTERDGVRDIIASILFDKEMPAGQKLGMISNIETSGANKLDETTEDFTNSIAQNTEETQVTEVTTKNMTADSLPLNTGITDSKENGSPNIDTESQNFAKLIAKLRKSSSKQADFSDLEMCIRFICTNKDFDKVVRKYSFTTLEDLLDYSILKATKDSLIKSFEMCVSYQNPEILKKLVSSPKFSLSQDESIKMVVEKTGNVDLLNSLISHYTENGNSIDWTKVLFSAIKYGRAEIIESHFSDFAMNSTIDLQKDATSYVTYNPQKYLFHNMKSLCKRAEESKKDEKTLNYFNDKILAYKECMKLIDESLYNRIEAKINAMISNDDYSVMTANTIGSTESRNTTNSMTDKSVISFISALNTIETELAGEVTIEN